jgi:hypothetical protein
MEFKNTNNFEFENLIIEHVNKKSKKKKIFKKKKTRKDRESISTSLRGEKNSTFQQENLPLPRYSSMRSGNTNNEKTSIIRRPRSFSLPPKKFHLSKEKVNSSFLISKLVEKKNFKKISFFPFY